MASTISLDAGDRANQQKITDRNVSEMQEWIKTQRHLPQISETMIRKFLHANEDLIDKSKVCVENYYTIRTNWTEIFTNRDLFANPDMLKNFNVVFNVYLPSRDPEGNVICVNGLRDTDPSKLIFVDFVKQCMMCVDSLLHALGNEVVPGVVMLVDANGASFRHIIRTDLNIAKKAIDYLQTSIPLNIRKVYVFNISALVDKFMLLINPFLSKEVRNRITFHTDIESLYEFIPKSCLPKDYGGNLDSMSNLHDKQLQLIAELADFFKEDEKTMRINDSLRQ